ncbi:hypothetical protein Pst134EB_016931 [Puccinia striiformis f. sp. tritici]|nr:hypothetical protein Pst134EB_016931 [Puccinia striiformis f. sp. tritici]
MSSEEANCNQNTEVVEEVEVKQTFILQTAGFDARFPNTNQTKHCWQAYVDHHKCKNRHGVEHDACRHFYRTFNSLCPRHNLPYCIPILVHQILILPICSLSNHITSLTT